MSLIELLVVIGIVVILAALLSATLKNSVGLANQAKCAENLRQIGAAFISYAGDNNGYIGDYSQHQTRYWGGKRGSWGGPATENRILYPYIQDPRLFRCPADIGFLAGLPDSKYPICDVAGNSYSVANSSVRGITFLGDRADSAWPGLATPGKLVSVDKPSKAILAFDATLEPGTVKYWHPHDRSNVVFLDGHVESFSKEFSMTSSYPKNPGDYTWGWQAYPGEKKLWDVEQEH